MNSPTDLGLFEKLDLAENLQKWVKIVKPELYSNTPPREVSVSAMDRENFFSEVFNDWSSAADIEDMPRKPSDRDKDDTRILISRWSQDLPASKNKRKRDEDGESPTKRRKRDEARFRHQLAYFGVGISSGKGEDKITFDVKDASNQIAAAQYVEWNTDDDIDELKRRALSKWERSERIRIREFNEKRILISSRNYIIRAAKAGFAEGLRPHIAPPEFVELAEPKSAFAILKKEAEAILKIIVGVEESLRSR